MTRVGKEEGSYGGGGGDDLHFITYSGSGAGNCTGPHGHPENCSEKGAKGRSPGSPCQSHPSGCSEHSTEPGKNVECAVLGGGVGLWNPAAGFAVGLACAEDRH